MVRCFITKVSTVCILGQVHILREGHIIFRNLQQLFVLCTTSQIISGDFEEYMNFDVIYVCMR